MYDLLVKGGHVYDPGQGLDAMLDIGISGGRIEAIEPEIDPADAQKTMQLKGQLVAPGLIDMHTHVMVGAQTPGVNELTAPPDLAGVHSGVTTVLDAGTTGAWNFGVYPRYVVGQWKTRLLCMLNVGKTGILGYAARKSEIVTPEDVDMEATVTTVNNFRHLIQGVKVRLIGPALETMGAQMVGLAKEAAREAQVPLMVHLGDLITRSPTAAKVTREVLGMLDPGDIVTHLCTALPGGVLDANQRIIPELTEARDKGVVFDPAHGRNGFNFEVAQRLADQEFHASTISTDLSIHGRKGPVYSLTEVMSKFMAVGYTLEQVVRMVTVNAARTVGMEESIGAIAVGREADLSILEVATGDWQFNDSAGNEVRGDKAIVPVHTVRAGELVPLDWGPHPWGWLPAEAV